MTTQDATLDRDAPERAAPDPLRTGSAPRDDVTEPEETVIRPRSGWVGLDWRELYRSRELLFFLVWRDVKIRYKQTVLGLAWAVLQPLFMMMIFTFIFGRFAGHPVGWSSVPGLRLRRPAALDLLRQRPRARAASAWSASSRLLTKIYFPRLLRADGRRGGLPGRLRRSRWACTP